MPDLTSTTPTSATRPATSPRPATGDRRSRVLWGLMLVGSLLMVLAAARYAPARPDAYFPQQRAVYQDHTVALLGHILGGSIALLIGPFQFLGGLRQRRPGAHRWAGRVYLSAVAAAAGFGLYLAPLAYGGLVSRVGFAALAVAWLVTGALALVTIRIGNTAAHRAWMIRNMALTYAAVTLRLWLPLLNGALGIEFVTAYRAVAWLCWLPNLVMAERLIRRRPGS